MAPRWRVVIIVLIVCAANLGAGQGALLAQTTVPSIPSFDRIVTGLMLKNGIPGGAAAVAKDGRLVMARGYGLADVELNQLVQPDSLFRICSVSKPITAVAILKLVEEGRLDLDAKAFRMLDHLKPPTEASVDPRIYDITIRQLLQHSGGWDSRRPDVLDPVFIPQKAAKEVGAPSPANPETLIRYVLGQRLDFDPGTRYAYSNFGYCVLGRIVEKITGQSYEQYVKSEVLRPIGITRIRIGHTFLAGRAEGEVRYYDYPKAPLVESVFPNVTGRIPAPYGQVCIETSDSCGGWIASAIDLVRFAIAIDGRRPPALLRSETLQLMTARPPPPLWVGTFYYYGLGWDITPIAGTTGRWWHTGSLPGSFSILVRTHDGYAWAALFNSAPEWGPSVTKFYNELNQSLWQAAREVTEWPAHDLFSRYQMSSTTGPVTSIVPTASVSSPTALLLIADYTPFVAVISVGVLVLTIGIKTSRRRGRNRNRE